MKRRIPTSVTLLLLGLAALCCLFGTLRGEGETVRAKAAAVCLECIGIG
ncbi:MAG: thioredoxin [Oscillospiraceae bacterium]|nr:thioredoxin [Oscillospiraceae bacterium]